NRNVQKVAMDVLQNQGEGLLASIVFTRFADCARGWIRPESFVVGAAIVVAGQTKTGRCPQNQERGRKPQRNPGRPCAKPAMRRIAKQEGGVERRKIIPVFEILALKGGPGRVNHERE